jgi:SAM-dependent methyltransferase
VDQQRLPRQDRSWSEQAPRYDELFLDPFLPGVDNPLLEALRRMSETSTKMVADLGCGTGPLLPELIARFGTVVALDFAPGMIARARRRLGPNAARVIFETRPMHALEDYAGRLDVAVAVNSLVMPDVRDIDRTLRAIRAALKPDGVLLGVVPAIDAIHYHTMLLMDRALENGYAPEEAERLAAHHAEHHEYDFAFGRVQFGKLRQKFWQPFEVRYRLTKAGFTAIEMDQVLYPWDDNLPEGPAFAAQPRSWDWFFAARP